MSAVSEASTGESPEPRPTWWRVIRAFTPDWWRHRQALGASYLWGLIAVGTLVITLRPLKILIDSELGANPLPEPMTALGSGLPPVTMIIALVCGAVVIGIVGAIASSREKIINARIRERMGVGLRERLLRHVQNLPLTFKTTDLSGEIVLRLVDDVFHYGRVVSFGWQGPGSIQADPSPARNRGRAYLWGNEKWL